MDKCLKVEYSIHFNFELDNVKSSNYAQQIYSFLQGGTVALHSSIQTFSDRKATDLCLRDFILIKTFDKCKRKTRNFFKKGVEYA